MTAIDSRDLTSTTKEAHTPDEAIETTEASNTTESKEVTGIIIERTGLGISTAKAMIVSEETETAGVAIGDITMGRTRIEENVQSKPSRSFMILSLFLIANGLRMILKRKPTPFLLA